MAGFARPGFGPLIVTPQSAQARPITRRFGFGLEAITSPRSCTHHGLSTAIRTGCGPNVRAYGVGQTFPLCAMSVRSHGLAVASAMMA